MSIERYTIHGEERSRERDQLDVALEVLAQDGDVVVHPQPSVLDVERERSCGGRQVELDGDTLIVDSHRAPEPELGKERKFSISTDIEGPGRGVRNDDDLSKMVVSNRAQEHWHASRITLMAIGPSAKFTS